MLMHAADTPPSMPALSWRRRQCAWLAAGGLLVLVVAYLVMVRTPFGQALGDSAYLARLGGGSVLRVMDKALLASMDIRFLTLAGLGLLVFGVLRRRTWLGMGVCLALAFAMVIAELLKRILPRPDLAPEFEALMKAKDGLNTYPSGHVTFAAGLALGIVILVPTRARPWVSVLGMLLTAMVATAVVVAGWHRPSDAIGGIGLALACLATAAAWSIRRWGRPVAAPSAARALPWIGAGTVVASALALTVTLLHGNPAAISKGPGHLVIHEWTFVATEVLIVIAALLAVFGLARVLRDVSNG